MKNLIIFAGLLMAIVQTTLAQVEVEVVLDQEQFLPGESVPLRVRIINHSGETLDFMDADWLAYSVEARDGLIVERSGNVVAPHGFSVQPSEMVTTKSDLSPCFQLSKPGRYSVTANVTIKSWGKSASSKPVFFDVVNGNKIWEQEFGIPRSTNSNSEPEVRKFILVQATLKNRLNLYLRLTDTSEARSFAVRSVGSMISFSNPKARLDTMNNLHILYQEASRQYRYVIINNSGDIVLRNTYSYTDSAPRLLTAENGDVRLTGGARLIADNDLPPKTDPQNSTNAPVINH